MWSSECWMTARPYGCHECAGARLKRWKVGSLNKTAAKQQEAMIKTDLMKGHFQVTKHKQVLL